MDSLPLEALEVVAGHLTPFDLAACCAVSIDWRDAFNQDRLWKPHCNKDTAKYLETAECRVEPRFESPESEDSTLNPICCWRMSYMRETHLQNNWRHGRSIKEEVHITENFRDSFYLFVSDDYALVSNERKVMLWNVRGSPVYVRDPMNLLFESEGYMFVQMINPNMMLIVQGLSVQVYCFKSILDESWELKHIFFLDGTESVSSSEAVSLMSVRSKYSFIYDAPIVLGSIFIGYTSEDPNILHIWNVQEGKKLRTVECKITSAPYNKIWAIVKSDKPSLDIVVIVRNIFNSKNTFHFYIYSLKHLDFLPFHETHDKPNYFIRDMKCVLQGRFLAVTVNGPLFIYNYLTSQLVHTISTTTNCDVLAVNNHILFSEQQMFYKIFNTNTLELKNITVTNNTEVPTIYDFGEILFGKFFYTLDRPRNEQVWVMGDNPMSEKVTWLGCLKYDKHSKINKSNTKLIVVPSFHENYFIYENFW
ncbi:hypothetical protein J6590_075264 [Homalodisca vitripennis]|nr:hypothetical protein J6590_075264 [Homalodisca vitripennis]